MSVRFLARKARWRCARLFAALGLRAPLTNGGYGPEYWRSRKTGQAHGPENYTREDNSTRVLFEDILKAVGPDASFLEVGCNAGRNLDYLHAKGFRDLAGIEINAASVHETLKKAFPELYATGKFFVGNAADEIKKIPDSRYDVVFSIAVLEHIAPRDQSLFLDMVRVSKKYVAVITGENGLYDFERIFGSHNCSTAVFRLFYGDGHGFSLPTEPYDEEKHFFDSMFLRVFIKKARP